jgi:hypothetical protein
MVCASLVTRKNNLLPQAEPPFGAVLRYVAALLDTIRRHRRHAVEIGVDDG